MIKIRNKRIALLLVLTMLATLFVGVGAASAATSENGLMTISKSINKNIAEESADDLGYVKVSISSTNVEEGTLFWSVTLPDDVYFVEEDGDTSASGTEAVAAGATKNFTLPLDQVWVDSSSDDDIYVDVTISYVDLADNYIDSFDGELLLAQKGDQAVTVTAASPKSVSMGFDKKIAKITFTEDIAGSLEADSRIAIELPDGFEWSDMADLTQGAYGQLTFDYEISADDDQIMYLTILTESTSIADKIKFVGYIDVYPDAPDGDVVVEVYDDSETGDSNIDDTDLTVAVVGGAEVTVTAEDTSSTSDYVYRGSENQEIWEITLETSGSFSSGDDLLLELPNGVEWMEWIDDAAVDYFDGFINHGLYDDNQGLWLTVEADTTSDLVIDGNDEMIGLTPAAALGDLELELSGDVVDATVVITTVVDRVTVAATKTNVKIGLDQVVGEITLTEVKNKALAENEDIYLSLPNGVEFSTTPKAWIGDEELDVEKTADDKAYITVDNLKTNDKDEIVINNLKFDIDARFLTGSEIVVKLGGGADWERDQLNQLDGSDDAQFEKESDDTMYTVAVAQVGTAQATKVVFTLGATSYVKDGVTFSMDVAPFAQNNRTYVPVRFIANALGVPDQNIYWDQVNQTVTLIKDNNVVQFKLGSTTRLINAIPATMDVAPVAQNGRVFLPARFVAEAFGAIVGWDAAFPNQVLITME